MSLSAIVRALVTAGATPEMILAAVEAAEAANNDALAQRRANDAERQQRRRDRESNVTSRDVTVTERDPLPLSPSPQTPQPHTPAPGVNTTRVRAAAPTSEFDEWYAGYPHKVGKGAALKAFPKARSKATLAELIEATERYVRTKPPDRSWCNPATWLNDQRWLDRPNDPTPQSRQANDQRNPDQRQLARYENYAAALRGAERVTADG